MTEGKHYLSSDRYVTFEELDEIVASELADALYFDDDTDHVIAKWMKRANAILADRAEQERIDAARDA